jgi:hypothetical protein
MRSIRAGIGITLMTVLAGRALAVTDVLLVFNRALCLVRLGRREEARAALEPFAAGAYARTDGARPGASSIGPRPSLDSPPRAPRRSGSVS